MTRRKILILSVLGLIAVALTLGQSGFRSDCAFRGSWAVISRDLGHAFHGIAGSHFMPSGRLANR
ncbi:hypothetical protein JNX05_19870 [Pseudosulfitobacter pseudonitzschiae]|nr:hypothetical protein JNX05_19870 [Pseudosulfitobacter pseudonitzschiae]